MDLDLKAIFKFVCENPPTIMIGGGILFYLLGSLSIPFNSQSAATLLSTAPWLVGGGFILQILWLFRGAISDFLTR